MSLCQEAYRRGATVALVLALVLIALPSMLKRTNCCTQRADCAVEHTVPKVDLFLGYQWLNPGGKHARSSVPPLAIKVALAGQGLRFQCGLQL